MRVQVGLTPHSAPTQTASSPTKAFYVIYDGAIYLHQGQSYVCTSLDLKNRVALVRPTRKPYYTSVSSAPDQGQGGAKEQCSWTLSHNALHPTDRPTNRPTDQRTNPPDPPPHQVQDVTDVHVTGGRVAYPTPREAMAAIDARRGGAAPKQEPPKAEPKPEVEDGGDTDQAGTDTAAPPEASQQQQSTGGGGGGEAKREPPEGCAPAPPCPLGCSSAACESCYVTVRFLGYHRVAHGTGEITDSVQLFLPDSQWVTQATYVRLPPTARAACLDAAVDFRESVHAAAHALLNVLPLYLVCNATDVATECDNPYDTRFRPDRLLLYDKQPGGTGLAAQATPLFPELLRRAVELVEECPCTNARGCPSCTQHLDCKNYVRPGGG